MEVRAQERNCETETVSRHLRLESLFREHGSRIIDYAIHRGAGLSEPEDILSEVFVVVTRRFNDLPDHELPWLYGIARKVLANQMRGRRRRFTLGRRVEEHAPSEEGSWLPQSFLGEDDSGVLKALSQLSEEDREVLLLVAWDDLKYEEAARSLGCTRDAFAQRLSRARRRLLARMDDVRTYDETEWAAVESKEP